MPSPRPPRAPEVNDAVYLPVLSSRLKGRLVDLVSGRLDLGVIELESGETIEARLDRLTLADPMKPEPKGKPRGRAAWAAKEREAILDAKQERRRAVARACNARRRAAEREAQGLPPMAPRPPAPPARPEGPIDLRTSSRAARVAWVQMLAHLATTDHRSARQRRDARAMLDRYTLGYRLPHIARTRGTYAAMRDALERGEPVNPSEWAF